MDYKKMWYELKKYLINEDLGGILLQMERQEVEEVLGSEEKSIQSVCANVEDTENRRLLRGLDL